jgi:hypothetical protein
VRLLGTRRRAMLSTKEIVESPQFKKRWARIGKDARRRQSAEIEDATIREAFSKASTRFSNASTTSGTSSSFLKIGLRWPANSFLDVIRCFAILRRPLYFGPFRHDVFPSH